MFTIYANGYIFLDDQDTGLSVTQRANGTVLFVRENRFAGINYQEVNLPHARYSLAHDAPASGNPGRAQFEADVRAYLTAQA